MSSEGREIVLRMDTAHKAGRLSDAALDALNRATTSPNLSLGTPLKDFDPEEGLLVTVMPDDSSSLNRIVRARPSPGHQSRRMLEGEGRADFGLARNNYEITHVEPDNPASNAEAIRIGHNAVVDALLASPHPDHVLMATRYLNGHLLNPYGPLSAVKRLDRSNFRPRMGTPLNDETVEMLKMVLAKYEQFRGDWREARTVTLLVTDGQDEHSRIQTPQSVAEVIKSMRGTGHHIIAAMGIEDGETDFRKSFTAMGIDPNWILTTGSTKEEIQKAFGLFAEAASKATVSKDFQKLLTEGIRDTAKP